MVGKTGVEGCNCRVDGVTLSEAGAGKDELVDGANDRSSCSLC